MVVSQTWIPLNSLDKKEKKMRLILPHWFDIWSLKAPMLYLPIHIFQTYYIPVYTKVIKLLNKVVNLLPWILNWLIKGIRFSSTIMVVQIASQESVQVVNKSCEKRYFTSYGWCTIDIQLGLRSDEKRLIACVRIVCVLSQVPVGTWCTLHCTKPKKHIFNMWILKLFIFS